MDARRIKTWLMLLAVAILTGCSTAPVRAFQRFREQRVASYWAQHQSAMESLEASGPAGSISKAESPQSTPAKLPAAIELPAPSASPQTLPSGLIEPAGTPNGAHVIFASTVADSE